MKTQEERVLEYLENHKEIASRDAYIELGITQLGTRIFNLKKMGYVFGKNNHKSINAEGRRTNYCSYYLIGKEA